LLDALNAPERDPWTLVDVVWTSNQGEHVKDANRNSA
jgi:hypothetical protein